MVSQFRPPVGACVVELPAGLIDAGETDQGGVQRAALRELAEETGYDAQSGHVSVRQTSTVMFNDPGMSGANMKLCTIDIALSDDAPEPLAHPDEGEYIEKHLVPLKSLAANLDSTFAI